jgi:hypothetical protein
VNRLRAFWGRYEERVLNESPLAAYARLHVVAPVASVAVVGFLFVGIALPQGRQPEDAATLMEAGHVRQAYEQLRDRDWRSEAEGTERKIEEARAENVGQLLTLARSSGLRNCRWNSFLVSSGRGVECEGRRLKDGVFKSWFWVGLCLSVLCLLTWVFVQLRDSWMLPDWNPRLWYTPVYAGVIGLIMCGPFVMAAAYFQRASSDYHVPPAEWFPAVPGVPLYLLVVMQATAVVLASVELRPRAEYFAIGGAAAVGAGLIGYLLVPGGEWEGTAMLVALAFLEALVVVLVMLHRRLAPTLTPERWLGRIFDLSGALVLAWGLLIGRAALDDLGVRWGYLDLAFTVAVYGCLLLHVMNSQRRELELGGSG